MNADTMIGAEIRAARCGVTQDALAERMRGYGFGWHQQTVLKVESGKRPLKLAEAQVVAIILGTTVERLLPPAPTPPRPDEPQGLGAVVLSHGREWVHFGNGCWIAAVPNAQLTQASWAELDVRRDEDVLSEGVTP